MSQPRPTEAELQILQILWQHGPSTVREVHERLNPATGYTTTLKLMQIMHEKGIVDRTPDGRQHVYRALLKEDETQRALLDRFLDTTFRGSAMKLVMQALGNRSTSDEELQQIRTLLDQLEKGKK
ncbi:Predicted transcriptional regulator [Catalinimonas alkaloidigena]|uniref:Predicted transcriptional regulator n=1 Tax=Catalinimonas alkaloidigena TaxID=1075417 RepID=A0A1G9BF84_9BACT|nr:BlaI/MecI/CopY family transcriptional regulator [Catalinimonas alkaloidigena]SDK38127.1 Predicted transcriptional regulator [Catalinimonas alkaloidigena]